MIFLFVSFLFFLVCEYVIDFRLLFDQKLKIIKQISVTKHNIDKKLETKL